MVTAAPKRNLAAGIGGALVGAVIGAFAWAYLVSATNYKIGFAALGVGALAGFLAGKLGGSHPALPIAAGVIGLLGCVLGDLMIDAYLVAEAAREFSGSDVSTFTVFKEMVKDPANVGWEIYKEGFEPLDALFYALAAVFGFRLAKQFGERAANAADPWPAPSSDESTTPAGSEADPAAAPTGAPADYAAPTASSTGGPVSLEKAPDAAQADAGPGDSGPGDSGPGDSGPGDSAHEGHDHGPGGHAHPH